VNVGFFGEGVAKSTMALGHARHAAAQEAEEMKAWWRERLAALKRLLEGGDIDG
jgi:hypothetical protein